MPDYNCISADRNKFPPHRGSAGFRQAAGRLYFIADGRVALTAAIQARQAFAVAMLRAHSERLRHVNGQVG